MIPKTILQTSKDPYPNYVKEMWRERIDESWTIDWFDDARIIQFFKDNPLPEFPNVIDVFYSFKDGGHKADLFRYYYLYLNGGFFIDSDIMTHVHMNEIYSDQYDHILVLSELACNRESHPEIESPIIFNGLMGCVPKSQIVYTALVNAYSVKTRLLDRQRLYFVYMLYVITQQYKNNYKILFYNEYLEQRYDVLTQILNHNNTSIATHFFGKKVIPNNIEIIYDTHN